MGDQEDGPTLWLDDDCTVPLEPESSFYHQSSGALQLPPMQVTPYLGVLSIRKRYQVARFGMEWCIRTVPCWHPSSFEECV
jgi:hypothetical protein